MLAARGVCKSFGTIVALKDVDLSVAEGEIHVLLGENGAGKTTLVNILYGIYQPDRGEVEVYGRKVQIRSPRDAIANGIVLVQQHPMLIDRMSVAENLALGFRGLGLLAPPKRIEVLIRDYCRKYGFSLDPHMPVSNLTFSEKQQVELIRALLLNAKLIILDEPTAMLTSLERRRLFSLLRGLVSEGRSVLLITHKIVEALEVSDWITVLRRGEVVASRPKSEYSTDELVRLVMGGNRVEGNYISPHSNVGARGSTNTHREVLLSVNDLTVLNDVGEVSVNGVTLSLSSGEVVGIAGITGNGQKELAEAIVGLRKVVRGRVVVSGIDVTNKGPAARIKAGLAYIPEERLKYGIIGDMSVAENLILKSYSKYSKFLILRGREVAELALKSIKTFEIVTRGPSERVKALSGGNIQRLIIARELGLRPRVIIAHNPTLGLDLSASKLVHEQLMASRNGGAGVLLISEDLDEVLKLSDRVLVMYRGKLVYEAERGSVIREELERAMLGVTNA